MEHITIANLDYEIEKLIEHCGMSPGNLEMLNVLFKARKNISRMPCRFDEEQAREWVARMSPPAKWTMEQTTALMHSKGYSHRPCEFWAVMNMLYSDYGKMLAKYNADKPEVYADMTDAWITDPDTREQKTGRYYRDVVS